MIFCKLKGLKKVTQWRLHLNRVSLGCLQTQILNRTHLVLMVEKLEQWLTKIERHSTAKLVSAANNPFNETVKEV